MNSLLGIVLLAVLQGLTEFLPVSSSGHLVIAMAILERFGYEVNAPLTVNIALHVGTLAALVAYFWRKLWQMLIQQWRVAALVIVASIPAGVVGVLLRQTAEDVLESPWVAVGGLVATGLLLYLGEQAGRGERTYKELSLREAMLIGCFQAVAIVPGVSRSGSTIVGGMLCGLAPSEATVFSFLMAVPVMAGAGLLEAGEVFSQPQPPVSILELAAGGACAALVGWLAIAWLLKWVRAGKLRFFAYWVFAVAACTAGWLILAP
ncbi:MAG: undecaprenyl-diphosphate phosphatase [Thermoguttaceae bacterium]|nr:undecaprenyl-diphosphate phosphatase [Thermoguttaceae bacterium]MDW8078380.1 undecaprenyl-diphosphate phosphatase [Thermoguttaceae bacterium]